MSIDRRSVLKSTAAAAVVGGPFAGLVAAPAEARRPPNAANLVPIPDLRDGEVRLHLPRGFQYRSFHDTESTVVLDDGTVLPGRHDGMGAFPGPNGNILLVRNHEVTNSPNNPSAFGPGTPYDAAAGAGTTTIEVTKYGEVERAFTSLNGTMFNCSGGIMPWGSWITCEETVNGPDVGPDFTGARPTPSCSRSTATSSRSRRTGRATGSRSPGRDASPTRRSPSTPRTASSTSPRTTSSSPPASTATSRSATR